MSQPPIFASEVGTDNEIEIEKILPELAKVTVGHLKEFFHVAPLNRTWDEIEKALSEGKQLKDVYQLSDDYMNGTYNDAKEKLAEDDFNGAKEIFLNLCLFNPTEPKYWGGLGKCFEGLKLYNEAVEVYKMLTLVTRGAEPLPYLCIGYCYLKLNDKKNALEVLEEGKEICDPTDFDKRPLLEQFENLIAICNK